MAYKIDADKCIGCTACARQCPVKAISGERQQTHVIDPEYCINCGLCTQFCAQSAIINQWGAPVKPKHVPAAGCVWKSVPNTCCESRNLCSTEISVPMQNCLTRTTVLDAENAKNAVPSAPSQWKTGRQQ